MSQRGENNVPSVAIFKARGMFLSVWVGCALISIATRVRSINTLNPGPCLVDILLRLSLGNHECLRMNLTAEQDAEGCLLGVKTNKEKNTIQKREVFFCFE